MQTLVPSKFARIRTLQACTSSQAVNSAEQGSHLCRGTMSRTPALHPRSRRRARVDVAAAGDNQRYGKLAERQIHVSCCWRRAFCKTLSRKGLPGRLLHRAQHSSMCSCT